MLKLRGLYCPIATPFDASGELNPVKIRQNVARLERTALAGYVVGSAVGEGPLLSDEERRRLYTLVAEAAGEGKQLIASVDSASPRLSASLAEAAQEAGYIAVSARRPLDYETADAALFFSALADASVLPVLIEGRPGDSTEALPAESAHPNVAGWIAPGAVDSSVVEAGGKGFHVLAGDEAAWPASWDAGVQAAVLPLTNVVPFHWLSVAEALRTREPEAAAELASRADRAVKLIWKKLGPAGVKWASDLRGAYGGISRPPLKTLSPAQKAEVEKALEGLQN